MIHELRVAIAASTALALCACATPLKTTEFDAVMPEIPAPVVETVTDMIDDANVEGPTQEAIMPDVPEATDTPAIIAPNETLLYGAMTKYELTRFVEAVRALKLESAFESETPMTLFAPNNQAFEYAALSTEADIANTLKGHIVPGALDVAALKAAATANGAPLKLTSLAGTELTVYVMDETVKIAGPSGTLATITQADSTQSNGILHQINSVLKLK
ncbi:fasciclin domain-containing protein [Fretibacter rubidus]|uniref:fasciclin domain-containing protein n=1 Tax=Fretibacter rubidus TaxID=570162 RepID=UPI00352BC59B